MKDNETKANEPQAITRIWLKEGGKQEIRLTDYDYVFVYYYKLGESSQ